MNTDAATTLGRAVSRRIRRGARAALEPLARAVGTIERVEVDRPVAALTFDEGPDPEVTPRLLDLLSAHGVKATFFCVGKFAAENPGIVRRMHEEGHVVGNHTWDHPSMPRVTGRERRRQLRRCSEALGPHESPYFRPPYGDQSVASHLDTLMAGYQVVGWGVDGQDWLDHDGERIAGRILGSLRPGSIALLHDRILSAPDLGYLDREPMLEAVSLILDELEGGFDLVTLEELLESGRPHRVHWYRRADAGWLNSLEAPGGDAWRYPA